MGKLCRDPVCFLDRSGLLVSCKCLVELGLDKAPNWYREVRKGMPKTATEDADRGGRKLPWVFYCRTGDDTGE